MNTSLKPEEGIEKSGVMPENSMEAINDENSGEYSEMTPLPSPPLPPLPSPPSLLLSLSGSDCYTRSTGTSPYCQLRTNYNVIVYSCWGSFPLCRIADSSSFSLYSVRLLGMRQHVLQPFIFHLNIGIVKESLTISVINGEGKQCETSRR